MLLSCLDCTIINGYLHSPPIYFIIGMCWTCIVKGGVAFGSDVQSFSILDGNLRSHVLFRTYAYDVLDFLWSNWVFLAIELLEVVRTDVYLHLRRILNNFLCRIYLLDNVHDGAWIRRTLILNVKKAIVKSLFLYYSNIASLPIPLP